MKFNGCLIGLGSTMILITQALHCQETVADARQTAVLRAKAEKGDAAAQNNVKVEVGRRLNVMGDVLRVILSHDDTGGSMTLVQQRSLPGAGIPLHVDAREDEIFQVLEGQVEFQVGEKTTAAEPGTVVYAPKHLPHSFRVVGSESALIQIAMVPGGLERMIEEIMRLPAHPTGKESRRSVKGMESNSCLSRRLVALSPNVSHSSCGRDGAPRRHRRRSVGGTGLRVNASRRGCDRLK
jgi:quercetin dioxygenase-like cupin family protein